MRFFPSRVIYRHPVSPRQGKYIAVPLHSARMKMNTLGEIAMSNHNLSYTPRHCDRRNIGNSPSMIRR